MFYLNNIYLQLTEAMYIDRKKICTVLSDISISTNFIFSLKILGGQLIIYGLT